MSGSAKLRRSGATAAAVLSIAALYPLAAGPAWYAAERRWIPFRVTDAFTPAEEVLWQTPLGDAYGRYLMEWQDAGISARRAR